MHFCIVGTSRSGSTLLRDILSQHTEIAIFNETHWLPKLFELYGTTKAPAHDLLKHAQKVTWDTGRNLFNVNIAYTDKSFEQFMLEYSAMAETTPTLTVAEFHETVSQIIWGKNTTFWADKTPDYGYYMGMIQQLWPQCKFVHIVRDGIQCSYSMSKHSGCQLQIAAQQDNWIPLAYDSLYEKYHYNQQPLDDFLASWSRRMVRIRDEARRLTPGSYFEISYETLLQTPEAALIDVVKFLNIPADSTWLHNSVKDIDPRRSYARELGSLLRESDISTLISLNSVGSLDLILLNLNKGSKNLIQELNIFKELAQSLNKNSSNMPPTPPPNLFDFKRRLNIQRMKITDGLNRTTYHLLDTNDESQTVDALLPLIELFRNRNNIRLALHWCQQGLQRFPGNNKLLLKLKCLEELFIERKDCITIIQAELQAGHTDQAYRIALTAIAQYPNYLALQIEVAKLLQTLERWQDASEYWRRILRQQPDAKEVYLYLSHALLQAGEFKQLEELSPLMLNKWPDHINLRFALPRAYEKRLRFKQALKIWLQLASLYPENLIISINTIRLYLKLGYLEEAQATLNSAIKKSGYKDELRAFEIEITILISGHKKALAYINKLLKDSPGNRMLRNRKFVTLMQMGNESDAFSYLQTLGDEEYLQEQFSQLLILYFITIGNKDNAEKLIRHIPEASLTANHVNAKCWLMNEKRQFKQSKKLFDDYSKQTFLASIANEIQELNYIGEMPIINNNEPALFSIVRNEAQMLPSFINHYRTLGINRFFIVDNDSTDGTLAWLKQQTDIYLFTTTDSYRESSCGMRWINELIANYAQDCWCLYVDCDEFLVYPCAEDTPIQELIKYLESKDFEAVSGFMLDMFPEKKQDALELHSNSNILDITPYFDKNFTHLGAIQAPYKKVVGGFRKRFFWDDEADGNWLVKTPLIKSGKNIHFLSSSHTLSPAKISDVNIALLHFKFIGDFELKISQETVRKEHFGLLDEYARYKKKMGAINLESSLISANSIKYQDSKQLEDLAIISRGEWNIT